nr:DNA circularization N-terminal domain-containing protein [Acetobacter oeni]
MDALQPASWRGIEFAVERSEIRRGRRTAVHEYPFRDQVWVEDLGRGVRSYAFTGFVVGDDCYDVEQALLAQAEIAGPGTLVHPTLGSVTVTLAGPLVTEQVADRGRCVSVRFEFIETGESLYPTIASDTQSLVGSLVSDLTDLVSSDFISTVADAIEEGASVVSSVVSAAVSWASAALLLVSDAGLVVGAVAGLAGNYGRYSTGNRTTLFTNISTVDDAISSVVSARAVADACAASVGSAAGDLTDGGVSFCAAAWALTEAIRACCCDPADALRLLSVIATYTPTIASSSAPVGAAIQTAQTASGQVFRRSALASLATACADYQPSSYDDAIAVRASVVTLFDAAVLDAGDSGQDQAYLGLRALRTAVSVDVTVRGASLARLMEVDTPAPAPALSLAYRLYADASRSDDLIARADPVHPAFMPTTFKALSS